MPTFFSRAIDALDRVFGFRYRHYHRLVEPVEISAYLVARQNLRPSVRLGVVLDTRQIGLVHLIEFFVSLESQSYRRWNLRVETGGAPHGEIARYLSEMQEKWGERLRVSETADAEGDGDFVVFAKACDVLHKHALMIIAVAITERSSADLVFTDYDRISDWRRRHAPIRRQTPGAPLIAARQDLVRSHRTEAEIILHAMHPIHAPFVLYHRRT